MSIKTRVRNYVVVIKDGDKFEVLDVFSNKASALDFKKNNESEERKMRIYAECKFPRIAYNGGYRYSIYSTEVSADTIYELVLAEESMRWENLNFLTAKKERGLIEALEKAYPNLDTGFIAKVTDYRDICSCCNEPMTFTLARLNGRRGIFRLV